MRPKITNSGYHRRPAELKAQWPALHCARYAQSRQLVLCECCAASAASKSRKFLQFIDSRERSKVMHSSIIVFRANKFI